MANSGIELWERAKSLIPGGNQLLSKRVERFLPQFWPAYYSKAKGCEVWDLDGNHYFDFAQMGVGSCTLGYANPDVNAAVVRTVRDGSMCTLNAPDEVELAERLIALHPWAEMARFGRTGGEACSIAIRIARAASGRGKIAFCGYHGWHDWYLSSNLGAGENLDGHLLPGLNPTGVPRELQNTAFPFDFNNYGTLENLANQTELGAIIMEPRREHPPDPGFLESVRKLATRKNIVLIFDEITSGFRMNLGGIHMTLGVEPDMAVFGKALGNGYPIAAILGKREIMDYAQESFISSTYWTERIGFVAALATLSKMGKEKVQESLIRYGERINRGWEWIAEKNGIQINISGIPPLTHLSFQEKNALTLQTLFAQEMLKKGFLAGSAVYTCNAYTEEIIDSYIEASDQVFKTLRKAIDSGTPEDYLNGPVIIPGFKRLT
jgi:glutamate-1-semialdehyde 2,1-aminomutase